LFTLAADLWSLDRTGGGDSDSVNQSSSVTSAGVCGWGAWSSHNRDSLVYDVIDAIQNTGRHRLPVAAGANDVDDDTCYRTLADDMTAGAYRINRRAQYTANGLAC